MAKRSKCATFGAHIVVHGDTIGDAKLHAETTAPFCDMTYVNGYDDVPIIAGAGTLGLETLPDANRAEPSAAAIRAVAFHPNSDVRRGVDRFRVRQIESV